VFKEFREFIARGNVLDLAVGVIIGGAFATITKSLTEDVILPIVGAIFGGIDFTSYFIRLGAVPAGYTGSLKDYAALKAAGVPLLGYGAFVTVVINFLILAFIIFLIVRTANRMTAKPEAAPVEPAAEPADITLLREIRDELKRSGAA
jgi:large conductance mechanosensitive channel